MPFPLLVPLLAIKGAVVGRFVYRKRVRARADRQFRCRVTREEPGAKTHVTDIAQDVAYRLGWRFVFDTKS